LTQTQNICDGGITISESTTNESDEMVRIAAYEKLGFVNTGPTVQGIGGGFIMDDYKMELKLL
jgi:hypothetical protein